jgi:hypothetical protein
VPAEWLLDNNRDLPAETALSSDLAGVKEHLKAIEHTDLPSPKDLEAFLRQNPEEATSLLLRLLQAQREAGNLTLQIQGYTRWGKNRSQTKKKSP